MLTRPWLPAVAGTHPGLFAVIAAEVFAHTGLGIDALAGRHRAQTWDWFGGEHGVTVLGIAHLTVAAVILVGAYEWWPAARAGLLASVTVYLLSAGLFLTAWTAQMLTGAGWTFALRDAVFNLFIGAVSGAAYREPATAGHYGDRDHLAVLD